LRAVTGSIPLQPHASLGSMGSVSDSNAAGMGGIRFRALRRAGSRNDLNTARASNNTYSMAIALVRSACGCSGEHCISTTSNRVLIGSGTPRMQLSTHFRGRSRNVCSVAAACPQRRRTNARQQRQQAQPQARSLPTKPIPLESRRCAVATLRCGALPPDHVVFW